MQQRAIIAGSLTPILRYQGIFFTIESLPSFVFYRLPDSAYFYKDAILASFSMQKQKMTPKSKIADRSVTNSLLHLILVYIQSIYII